MIDGGDKLVPEANNRVGLTLAVPIASKFSLKLAATDGLTATVGNDYTTLGMACQMVF